MGISVVPLLSFDENFQIKLSKTLFCELKVIVFIKETLFYVHFQIVWSVLKPISHFNLQNESKTLRDFSVNLQDLSRSNSSLQCKLPIDFNEIRY